MRLERLTLASERCALALLVLAFILFHFEFFTADDVRPAWLALLREAADLGAIALLGLATALWRASRFLKWPAVAAGMSLLAFSPPSFIQDWRWIASPERWLEYGPVLLTSYVATYSCWLLTFKFRGYAVLPLRTDEAPPERIRFSIKSLLALTIAAALAVRAGQIAYGNAVENPEVRVRQAFAGLGGSLGIAAGLVVWAALTPGSRRTKLVIAAATCPLLALVPPYLGGNDARFSPLMMLIGAHAALLAGALLVVGACGYCLANRMAGATCDYGGAGVRRGPWRRTIGALEPFKVE